MSQARRSQPVKRSRTARRARTWFLTVLVVAFAGMLILGPKMLAAGQTAAPAPSTTEGMTAAAAPEAKPAASEAGGEAIRLPFGPEAMPPLYVVLLAALIALAFGAYWWMRTIKQDPGSERMRGVAAAVREGAMAYLARQVKAMALLVIVIGVGLFLLYKSQYSFMDADPTNVAPFGMKMSTWLGLGISVAFLLGVTASYMAGYVGMGVAVRGNVRVAHAALSSFKRALETAFQAGAVSGMFTVGLGLLGATITFMVFRQNAMFVLVGFGFGGSLAALFMRVGGGIFTKAADVGADLVGKVEKNIPEDDPRNAATIADNVGDNVGDCAGMAADVFESYEVTLVAAIILAAAVGSVLQASGFGNMMKAGTFTAQFTLGLVVYALLVRAVGVVASIAGVFAVKGKDDPAMNPMKPINTGFFTSAAIATVGFFVVAIIVFGFGKYDFAAQKYAVSPAVEKLQLNVNDMYAAVSSIVEKAPKIDMTVDAIARAAATDVSLSADAAKIAAITAGKPVTDVNALLEGMKTHHIIVSKVGGSFWFLAFLATFIGIVLTQVIGKVTEHFTAEDKKPVTEIASSAKTGAATLILSGLSEGLESSVWGIVAIAVTIYGAYIIFPNPAMASYAIALTGLGLLATTGYVLAMDTYGPISDNANGIFEMSGALKNPDGSENKAAHNIVSRLDMVGNTTKALTKGFAIATAVIAAVALYRSYLDTVAVKDPAVLIRNIQVNLPDVFIGLLLGGAVPFLFSSFAIRAVSRAARQLVEEVRRQFKEIPGIWEFTGVGEKGRPDYARCVAISTAAAQKELLGPGLLAIFSPILVGFWLGAYALGGFLAGAILVGQLMAVFMSNTGGAWDNAKKKIEDGFLGGKGSDAHKAGVIGDTVGDPLKDTAGPALNPMIKVMNLVSILVAPSAVMFHNTAAGWVVVVLAVGILSAAILFSKRESAVKY